MRRWSYPYGDEPDADKRCDAGMQTLAPFPIALLGFPIALLGKVMPHNARKEALDHQSTQGICSLGPAARSARVGRQAASSTDARVMPAAADPSP
jgi:hypothetical protein